MRHRLRAPGKRGNRIRIAIATPQALRAHASNPGRVWSYWDLTPQLFGEPKGAWFDRSDLSVSAWSANWTVDIALGKPGDSALLARIALQQLVGRGTIQIAYITQLGQRWTTAQGTQATTYYIGNHTLSQARVWSWAPFSGTLFRHDIDHQTVPIYDAAMSGTDTGDWYDRYGRFPGAIESATVSGSTLYVAQGTGRAYCTASCSTSNPTLRSVFAQPAVYIARYNVNNWTVVGQRWIWNSVYGLGWPALQTDGHGDVGIVMRAAPVGQNAQPVAGLLTPAEDLELAVPAGLAYETGDFYSLRPGRTARSFVMTAEEVQDDNGVPQMHWQYIEYGIGPSPYVSPPSVRIVSPGTQNTFTQYTPVTYQAKVTDPFDGRLPAAAIVWREDGKVIGTGATFTHIEKTTGVHEITVSAGDGGGISANDFITVNVVASTSSITVNITNPANNSAFLATERSHGQYCAPVTFTTTISGGSGPLEYVWFDTVSGNITSGPLALSKDPSPTLTLCAGPFATGTASRHDLQLTVSDANSMQTALVTVFVETPSGG